MARIGSSRAGMRLESGRLPKGWHPVTSATPVASGPVQIREGIRNLPFASPEVNARVIADSPPHVVSTQVPRQLSEPCQSRDSARWRAPIEAFTRQSCIAGNLRHALGRNQLADVVPMLNTGDAECKGAAADERKSQVALCVRPRKGHCALLAEELQTLVDGEQQSLVSGQ
jgi:hypothetical protein